MSPEHQAQGVSLQDDLRQLEMQLTKVVEKVWPDVEPQLGVAIVGPSAVVERPKKPIIAPSSWEMKMLNS